MQSDTSKTTHAMTTSRRYANMLALTYGANANLFNGKFKKLANEYERLILAFEQDSKTLEKFR